MAAEGDQKDGLGKDLISIVVPAYNHEEYIDNCIDSLLSQTYRPIELILLNDGSTDSTADKIRARHKECEDRFHSFTFIDKANSGVIDTINQGLALTTGKYLAVCASDDAYTPDAMECMHSFLADNPDYVLAVGDNYFMDEHGKVCYWDEKNELVYEKDEARSLTFGAHLKKIRQEIDFDSDAFGEYSTFFIGNYIPNGYLFDRDLFVERIGGYSTEAPLEDLYLHFQLSKHGKYKYIDRPLFYYRRHSGNFSVNRLKMVTISLRTLLIEEEYAMNNGYTEKFQASKAHHIKRVELNTPKNEDRSLSFKERIRSFLKGS